MCVKMYTFDSRGDWLKERRAIGGSDASAIIGMNPYKDNVQLWREKTGLADPEDISEKPYVKYGIAAEDHLRELFKLDFTEYRVEYVENNMFVNDKFPFAHASLDGWLTDQNGRKGILEIKTTNILQSMQKEKWKGRIPDNYYIQLIHYLLVTGFDFAVLKGQLKFDYSGEIVLHTRHYFIERADVENDINYLAKKEAEFWRYVAEKKEPPLILPEL